MASQRALEQSATSDTADKAAAALVSSSSTSGGSHAAIAVPSAGAGSAASGGGGAASASMDPQLLPVEARRTVLILMCILKVATSYDAGAFSLAIGAKNGIAADLDMDDAQIGFLGASVYLGNVVGCASCVWLFQQRSAKHVLSVAMMGHAFFTMLFALSSSYELAVLARLGIGFTLSFVVVYSVVWADVFSPQANATLWLALLNIGVPVGTLAGFVVGGIVVNSSTYTWRWIFFIKTLLMVPLVVFMGHVDPALIDDPATSTGNGRVAVPQADLWTSFVTNPLMMLNVAGLSVLYFVITGMQTFFTLYLRMPPFSASVDDIVLIFGFTAVSAPIFGVAIGGYVMDRYGNYHEHPDRAANLGAMASALAALFGFFTSMATTIATLTAHLWLMLFFGAAALPSAMGLIVSTVTPEQKNAASSFANIMFNVWGYFAGPMVCGIIATATNSLSTAMVVTLNFGWLGVIFFALSARVARTRAAALSQQRALAAAAAANNNNTTSRNGGGDGATETSNLTGADADPASNASSRSDEALVPDSQHEMVAVGGGRAPQLAT
jgi:predicted MFS family arabinose efflux permease